MGYYANGGGCLIIKKENFDKVVEAYHVWTAELGSDSSRMQDIKAIFEDQWFEVCFDEDGNLLWVDFPNEKYRDTGEFIKMLAPYAENGSHIDFAGEDGAGWRLSIYNHKYYETSSVVEYPGDPYNDAEVKKNTSSGGEVRQIYDSLCRALTDYENCDTTSLYEDIVSIVNDLAAKLN